MPNSHTRWNSVRVNNQIWHNTFLCERKILLSIGHSTSSFLTVPRRKLISNLRGFDGSGLDFDEQIIRGIIFCEHHLIDNTIFRVSSSLRSVLVGLSNVGSGTIQRIIRRRLNNFTDNDIISREFSSRADEAIMVKFIVFAVSQSGGVLSVDVSDLFCL